MKKFISFGLTALVAIFLVGCTIKTSDEEGKEQEKYDVVVIGSEPEGVIAAVAAAREGQKTLLLTNDQTLGGLFTIAKLNSLDLNYAPDGSILNDGLFLEFYNKIDQRSSFDVEHAERVFYDMVEGEKNLTVEFNVRNITPVLEEKTSNTIQRVTYETKGGKEKQAKADFFIDTTEDANMAHLAKANFTLGQEDFTGEQEFMSITPVFEVSGVNWEKLRTYLREDGKPSTAADEHSAWGLSQETKDYKSENENIRLRGLNIGKQDNGNVLINAFLIRGINPLDEKEIEKARKWSEEEVPKVVEYLKEHIAGFEEAKYVGIAEEFYVRETRHLIGEYRLHIDDVLENRDFDDRIAFGSYSVDLQGTKSRSGTVLGHPETYAVPFRSIVPKGFTNLLVASRSASYDSLPHGSARVVPLGMNIAESAGIISAYVNEQHLTYQDLIKDPEKMKEAQERIQKRNRKLDSLPTFENPVAEHWAYEGVKVFRQLGIISGGYKNEYHLEEPIKKQNVYNFARLLKPQHLSEKFTIPFQDNEDILINGDVLDLLEANGLTAELLSEETEQHVEEEYTVKRGTLYMVLTEIANLLEEKEKK